MDAFQDIHQADILHFARLEVDAPTPKSPTHKHTPIPNNKMASVSSPNFTTPYHNEPEKILAF